MSEIAELIGPDVARAADYISESWRQGVDAILETGRRLIEMRGQFKGEPGKWSRLIGANQWKGQSLLPFQFRHAYRLIAVAEDRRLLPHAAILPADSTTLAELSLGNVYRVDRAIYYGDNGIGSSPDTFAVHVEGTSVSGGA